MTSRGDFARRKAGLTRPSVEPLSQRAWGRVERRVFERLDRGELLLPPSAADRRPGALLWSAVAVLVVAASLLLWWRFESASSPAERGVGEALQASIRANTPPQATPAPLSAPAAPAQVEAPAVESTRIVTTSASTQTTLGEAELRLSARSEVTVSGSDGAGWLIRLERGQVDCHVAPRRGRPDFVVQAGETRVSVVGTRFSVRRRGDVVSVRVREGQVRVLSGSLESMLGPGEEWPPPSPRAESTRNRRARSTPVSRSKGSNSAASSREQARERFERASRLEASDPELALTLYGELARSGGAWAANALYAQARLELERGSFVKARGLLARYIERYPEGLNIVDVRALLSRVNAGRD
jgi:ferric-dicitrate binding protein FerR (iron transport regulator)